MEASVGFCTRLALTTARIEESMWLAFVGLEFAAIAGGRHGLGEEFHRGKWHRLIFRAVEEDARRQAGADEMIGGDLLRSSLGAGADTGEAGFGEQAGVAFRRRRRG